MSHEQISMGSVFLPATALVYGRSAGGWDRGIVGDRKVVRVRDGQGVYITRANYAHRMARYDKGKVNCGKGQ